ncbi:hypothetical protein HanPI659440_Chr11g0425301 [Helianthus annuus]|nr:hypothetical protein HanPI659440_Chr11g0425301 [Helianthus annuus]
MKVINYPEFLPTFWVPEKKPHKRQFEKRSQVNAYRTSTFSNAERELASDTL